MVAAVDWWELDRTLEPDHLTSLYIPARSRRAGRRPATEVARLVDLMDTLRERCPWDRARPTPRSCRTSSRSATRSSTRWRRPRRRRGARAGTTATRSTHLQEELGDLLFQIVFHARLADEEGQFDLADVARGVHDKLVHRHPHVFGDVDADDGRPGRDELGGDQEEREGPAQRHRGHPVGPPRPDAHDRSWRARRASVGLEPDRRRCEATGRRRGVARARLARREPTLPTTRCRVTAAS